MMRRRGTRVAAGVTLGVGTWLSLLVAGCSDPAAEGAAAPAVADAGPPPMRVVATTLSPDIPMVKGQPARLVLQLADDRPPLSSLRARVDEVAASTAAFDAAGRMWVLLVHVPIDLAETEVTLRLEGATAEGPTGFVLERRVTLVDGDYDETHIRVAKKFVRPPKKERRRIRQERKDIASALEDSNPERLWRGSFVRPTRTAETSPFGTKRIYNKRKKPTRHLGWDLDGNTGDPIRAVQSGRVVLVQDRYYSGGTVVIDHGQSLYSLYFHMSHFDVKAGDSITKGQLLGDVGRSGRVTGPHLHLSIKLDGHYTDPETLLSIDLSADPLDAPPMVLPEGRASKLAPPEELASPARADSLGQ